MPGRVAQDELGKRNFRDFDIGKRAAKDHLVSPRY
jgi:hypothetical protein